MLTTKLKISSLTRSPVSELISFPNWTKVERNLFTLYIVLDSAITFKENYGKSFWHSFFQFIDQITFWFVDRIGGHTCNNGSRAAAALRAADAAATMLFDAFELSRLKLVILLLFRLLVIKLLEEGDFSLLPTFWDPCKACKAWAGVLVNCLGETRWVSLWK